MLTVALVKKGTKHYRSKISGAGWRQTACYKLDSSGLWTTDDVEHAEFILQGYLEDRNEKRMIERGELTIEIVKIPKITPEVGDAG